MTAGVPWPLRVGWRYLRSRRRERFVSAIALISGLGVAIGVMALSLVLSVMTGFEYDLRQRILGLAPSVVVLSMSGAVREPARIEKVAEAVEGVVASAPFIYGQVMLSSATGVSGAVLRGVDPERMNAIVDIASFVTTGDAAQLGRPREVATLLDGEERKIEVPQVVLGFELANMLGVGVGDWISVTSPQGAASALGFTPKVRRFAVGAIFDSGMYDYDSTVIFVALDDARRLLGLGDAVTGVELRAEDPDQARAIGDQIETELGYPFYTRDWMAVNRNLFVAFQLEKLVQFVVLLLIVLVAAFNIASTLVLVVMEKRKDIAILKSMGATNRAVGAIFVLQGAIVGVVGTALGLGAGLGGALLLRRYPLIELPEDVFYVSTVPVRIEPLNFALIGVAAVLICVLATLYPAWRASRLAPVEVIRYE